MRARTFLGDLGDPCVTTEARHLNQLGQLELEFEQDSNTDSERESNPDLHSARTNAQAAQHPTAEPGKKAAQSEEQSTQGEREREL